MTNIETVLSKLELTNGETKAYLALLKLGPSKVGPIVSASKVSYSKIYDVLDRLVTKGIVSFTIKEKTKLFQAISPNRLLEIVEKKEEEIKNTRKELQNIMPELELYSMKYTREEAEIFKGFKGLKTAYEIFLKDIDKKTIIYFFYIYNDENSRLIDKFYTEMFELYKSKGHKWQGIETQNNSKMKAPSFMEFRSVNFPIPVNADISESSVLIISWSKEPTAILIRSKDIANNFRKYFESCWKLTKK